MIEVSTKKQINSDKEDWGMYFAIDFCGVAHLTDDDGDSVWAFDLSDLREFSRIVNKTIQLMKELPND